MTAPPSPARSPAGLRRFALPRADPPSAPAPGERCEMCGEPIAEGHGHVVEVGPRRLMCTCRPCALLFTNPGAAGGRYRAVPTTYRHLRDLALTDVQWDALGIPVRLAFFFTNTLLQRVVALYPSPAGATECLLPLGAWDDVVAANPDLAGLEPDVQALLVRGVDGAFEGHLVPIDACYQLVGLVRLSWRGFDGGAEAWEAIDGFFAGLRERGGGG